MCPESPRAPRQLCCRPAATAERQRRVQALTGLAAMTRPSRWSLPPAGRCGGAWSEVSSTAGRGGGGARGGMTVCRCDQGAGRGGQRGDGLHPGKSTAAAAAHGHGRPPLQPPPASAAVPPNALFQDALTHPSSASAGYGLPRLLTAPPPSSGARTPRALALPATARPASQRPASAWRVGRGGQQRRMAWLGVTLQLWSAAAGLAVGGALSAASRARRAPTAHARGSQCPGGCASARRQAVPLQPPTCVAHSSASPGLPSRVASFMASKV